MSGLPGPLKPLMINLPQDPALARGPALSHTSPVQQITEKHKYIVALKARNFTAKEVARMMDVSEVYVHQIWNWDHPLLNQAKQEAYDRMAETIDRLDDKFEHYATEALDKTVQIMRSTDITNARLAAKDIMDRAGYAPVKKVANVNAQVPSQEFLQAVERMEKITEVDERRSEWVWQAPVKVVNKP